MPTHRASRADRKALPTWDEMSDFDKGAALRHVYRASPPPRGHSGSHWDHRHAGKMFPAVYRDDPRLSALSAKAASRHAMKVTGGQRKIVARLSEREYARLYSLAARVQG